MDDDPDTDEQLVPISGKIRTHLANERTFLAWSRTGFTAIALGLGAEQLLDPRTVAGIELKGWLAASLIIFGFVLVVLGRLRYRQTAIGIRDNRYQTHRRGLEVIVIGAFIVSLISIAFVLRS